MDGSDYVTPVFVGGPPAVRSGDGATLNVRHFGMTYGTIDGEEQKVRLPLSVYEVCRKHMIMVLLWTSFPETYGRAPSTFHSIARSLAHHIAPPSSFPVLEIKNTSGEWYQFRHCTLACRLGGIATQKCFGLRSRKLCLISRNWYTSTGKNWGHRWREDMPGRSRREGQEAVISCGC
jgi:hypothetical protein